MNPHQDVTLLDYMKRALFVSAFVFVFTSPAVAYLETYSSKWFVSLIGSGSTGTFSALWAWWIDQRKK